jgi:hypothetical protein
MAKQQILFAKDGKNYFSRQQGNEVRLPKIIKDVSLFEMQFGFKQPVAYLCGQHRPLGIDSVSIPTLTNNVKI